MTAQYRPFLGVDLEHTVPMLAVLFWWVYLQSNLQYFYIKIETYRTIIFPVILCGCETWSLTLREERRLWVFENRVLRRFEPKRER